MLRPIQGYIVKGSLIYVNGQSVLILYSFFNWFLANLKSHSANSNMTTLFYIHPCHEGGYLPFVLFASSINILMTFMGESIVMEQMFIVHNEAKFDLWKQIKYHVVYESFLRTQKGDYYYVVNTKHSPSGKASLWSFGFPLKQRVFLWRCILGVLLIGLNLQKKLISSPHCARCGG